MSLAVTGKDLVTRALRTLGIYGQTDPVEAPDLQQGFELLNELVDSWAIQPLTVLTVNRQVYDLVAGQGGPSNPYTYGPGGDWDTGSAARPPSIQDANLILNTSSPAVEIPIAVLTTDMYAAQPIKELSNALPVTLYYNDTVPLAQVFFWPVPTQAANQIALYVPAVTAAFTNLSTLYVCPPGYLKAFRLCLCEAMLTGWAVPLEIAARIPMQAAEALAQLQSSNLEMADLSLDPGFTPQPHGTYVIQTDQGA